MLLRFKRTKDGHGSVRELFNKHIKEGLPLTVESSILLAGLISNVDMTGRLYRNQATLIRCQLDTAFNNGMMIDPLSILQNRGEMLSRKENEQFLKEVEQRIKLAENKTKRINSLTNILPLGNVREVTYAIKFVYAIMVLGTGELHDTITSALPN